MKELQKQIHKLAKEKGWWEEDRDFAEVVALAHSELSEALEEYRNSKDFVYYTTLTDSEYLKPEGIAIEMADVIIRILDWAEKEGVDMEEMIKVKHKYNTTRPYKHGGKKI